MYWCGERRELEQSLGRPLRPEDVINLLWGLFLADLPEDIGTRSRIISASNRRKELFTHMVEVMMGCKEELDREQQAVN